MWGVVIGRFEYFFPKIIFFSFFRRRIKRSWNSFKRTSIFLCLWTWFPDWHRKFFSLCSSQSTWNYCRCSEWMYKKFWIIFKILFSSIQTNFKWQQYKYGYQILNVHIFVPSPLVYYLSFRLFYGYQEKQLSTAKDPPPIISFNDI